MKNAAAPNPSSPASDLQTEAHTPAVTVRGLQSIRNQLTTGNADWQDVTVREAHIPVRNYYDPEVWKSEISHLFRALPLVCAHSSEIAPGQALAHDAYGVPVLMTRDASGRIHAFLNVCRHRGMRLVEATGQAVPRASMVCAYHGWTYKLDGGLRHVGHSESFDACAAGARDLARLPCEERHGLIWVVPDPNASGIDLDAFLGGMNAELPYYDVEGMTHFRTTRSEYQANWKLIMDAFLEYYHIRVLHKDTIYPFFTDGIAASEEVGGHFHSLVSRRKAREWAADTAGTPAPEVRLRELCRLTTPTHAIFPNTIVVFHPDYVSFISLYPTGPESFNWTHRMLIPSDKTTPDWQPHWDKTYRLIEEGVFQKEDIHCAVETQKGMKSGANDYLTAGRMEKGLHWFHGRIRQACQA